jgi:hypothetical protein
MMANTLQKRSVRSSNTRLQKNHEESGRNREESGKYSGISQKNLVGDEESKEMAFDDDGQHPTKTVDEVVEYPPPKNNHEESGKYSGISEKNLVGNAESKEMDNKRKDDDGDDDDHSSIGDGQEDDRFDDAEEDDNDDDHPGVGDGQEDHRFDDAEEIDPEDEEFDEPNDSQKQAEKTKYNIDAMEYLTTLQLATQTSVRELTASKKCKSPEVTIPLSLIIIYSRWARRSPLHFHEDSVHCLSVISNIVVLTPIQVLEAYRLRYEPRAKHLHVNVYVHEHNIAYIINNATSTLFRIIKESQNQNFSQFGRNFNPKYLSTLELPKHKYSTDYPAYDGKPKLMFHKRTSFKKRIELEIGHCRDLYDIVRVLYQKSKRLKKEWYALSIQFSRGCKDRILICELCFNLVLLFPDQTFVKPNESLLQRWEKNPERVLGEARLQVINHDKMQFAI